MWDDTGGWWWLMSYFNVQLRKYNNILTLPSQTLLYCLCRLLFKELSKVYFLESLDVLDLRGGFPMSSEKVGFCSLLEGYNSLIISCCSFVIKSSSKAELLAVAIYSSISTLDCSGMSSSCSTWSIMEFSSPSSWGSSEVLSSIGWSYIGIYIPLLIFSSSTSFYSVSSLLSIVMATSSFLVLGIGLN